MQKKHLVSATFSHDCLSYCSIAVLILTLDCHPHSHCIHSLGKFRLHNL